MRFQDYSRAVAAGWSAAGGNVLVLADVDSTNAFARRLARRYTSSDRPPDGTLVVAWEQTGGRGRRGRVWQSPAGAGVYASLLRFELGTASLLTAPLLVAVGACKALDAMSVRGCRLKWPNDLLVGGRKIGGILIESVSCGERPAVVIGVGVNWLEHPEQPAAATSIQREGAAAIDMAEAALLICGSIERELTRPADPAYAIDEYRQRTVHRAGDSIRCRVGSELVEGDFRGFDRIGRLRLEVAGQLRSLSAGDLVG